MLDHVRSTCAETCAETCAVPHVVDECPNRLWHLLLRRVSDPIGLESPWWERSRVDRSTGHIFHKRGIPVVSFFGFPRVSRSIQSHPVCRFRGCFKVPILVHVGVTADVMKHDETWWNRSPAKDLDLTELRLKVINPGRINLSGTQKLTTAYSHV